MSNTINITIELAQEDRARLDALLGKLTEIGYAIVPNLCIAAKASELDPNALELLKKQMASAPVQAVAATEADVKVYPTQEPKQEPHPEAASNFPATDDEPPFEVTPEPAPAPQEKPKEAPKPITLPEFQKAIVTLCASSPAMKDKVKSVVQKYAKNVSGVPEDKRAEVLNEISGLKG